MNDQPTTDPHSPTRNTLDAVNVYIAHADDNTYTKKIQKKYKNKKTGPI